MIVMYGLTFLSLLEAVVLSQPLGIRHKDVVFELRVLLHQREGLRQVRGQKTFVTSCLLYLVPPTVTCRN